MELKQLEYFQTVAQYESITKAAEKLYITQPALSKSIHALEQELGYELFVRRNQKITLNEKGRVYLRYVQHVFSILDSASRELRELDDRIQNTVMISIDQPDLYMELLENYLLEKPNVRIFQPSISDRSTEQMLLSRDIDFCITTPTINNPNLSWKPLMRDPLYLLVSDKSPLCGRSSVTLTDIADEPFVSMVPESSFRRLTDAYFDWAGFVPHITYELNEMAMIRKFVELGLGVALFPASGVLRMHGMRISQGGSPSPNIFPVRNLSAIPIVSPPCEREIGAYYLTDGVMTPAAADFFSFVVDYFVRLRSAISELEKNLLNE